MWLRNIKSRIAGNADCVSGLRIGISTVYGVVWDYLVQI